LNLKEVDYDYHAVHLVADGGQHLKDDYKVISPMCQVPTLKVDDLEGREKHLTQSMAIVEFLEEKYPQKHCLFPKDLFLRAKVREICEIINSGTQPIQNLAVLKYRSSDNEERAAWAHHFIARGLAAVEHVVKESHGKCCVGDDVTAADCFLVPQVYNAVRFKVDMNAFPVINQILQHLDNIQAFKKAHADQQPDCPTRTETGGTF